MSSPKAKGDPGLSLPDRLLGRFKNLTPVTFTSAETAMFTRHRALGYMMAADQVTPPGNMLEPKYFLYCHAIELALKAYLMVNGFSERKCRSFGHDLDRAVIAALEKGLNISDYHRAVVQNLSLQHNRPFSFRYFNADGWAAPSFENVSACCASVIRSAQGAVFVANGIVLKTAHIELKR